MKSGLFDIKALSYMGFDKNSIIETIKHFHILFKNNRNSAYVILSHFDSDINKLVLELLPQFMACKRYNTCVFVGSKEIRDSSVLFYLKEKKADFLIIEKELVDVLRKVQRTFFVYSNLFFADTIGFDDDNFFQMIGLKQISKRDVVARVSLEMSSQSLKEKTENDGVNHSRINWNNFQKWVSKDQLLYENLEEYVSYKLPKIIDEGGISENDVMIIYGFNAMTKEIIEQFSSRYSFKIVDNDVKKHGMLYNNVYVIGTDYLISSCCDDVKVIVVVSDYKNVCEELISYGYCLGKNLFPIRYRKDYLDETIESVSDELCQKLEDMEFCYEEIRKKFPKEYLLVNPHVSGDIYISCLYLEEYLRKNNIIDYVFLVSNNGSKKVAELFGYEAVVWDKDKLFQIVKWARYNGFKETKVKKLHLWIDNKRGYWDFFSDIDYNSAMQRLVFDSDVKMTRAKVHQEDSSIFFETYKLKEGKTVLISPYSHTVSRLDLKFFEELTKRLTMRGYCVCTNVSGDERPIIGTVGVSIPYINVVDFVNKCGFFIGARSGLCDVVSSTNAKMVVLYRAEDYAEFSLVEMGTKVDNIEEIIIDNMIKEEVAEKTVDFLCLKK